MILALLLLLLSPLARALILEIPSTGEQCVYDILEANTLVTGWFAVLERQEGGNTGVRIVASSPDFEELFAADQITEGKFSYTAPTAGRFTTCLYNSALVTRMIEVKLKSGVEAKDLSEIAQREHLKPLAVELLRIEEVMEEIRLEMQTLFDVEADMRSVNEWTNDRVKYLTMFSLFVIFTVGAWQVVHVRDFLEKKKVI